MSITNPSNGNQAVVTKVLITDEQLKKQLGELAQRWQNARDTDLEIRHQTGALLNQRYGNPDTRLQRGREIMLKVAEQLQVAQSELSRMRRFSFHFTSAADVKRDHPEVTNWTAVKGLLTTLKSANGQPNSGGARSSKSQVSNARKLKKIKHLLDTLPNDIREVRPDLKEEDREALRVQFQVVAKVFGDCLKASVVADELRSEASTPLAQMTA